MNNTQEITIVYPESKTMPHVIRFAQVMEHKLAENRHKGDREGWLKCSPFDLLRLLRNEVIELEEKLFSKAFAPEDVMLEAADVANFAMMVADSYENRLTTSDESPTT